MQLGVSRSRLFNLVCTGAISSSRSLLDFLLPPRCLCCSAATDVPGGLCPGCWSDMPFLEPPWCQRYGTPFTHDIGPDGIGPRAIANPPDFARARAAVLYSGPARELVLRLKFSRHRELAPPMGQWMARAGAELIEAESLIVPVPLHRLRLWQRRFNQAADLAKAVAEVSGAEFVPDLLRRNRRTRQQVGLNADARKRNVRGAFEVRPHHSALVSGRHVVLVDDVFTTGSTVSACTKVLTSEGAARVDVLTFANADPISALEQT